MYKGNKRKTKELTRAYPRRTDEPSGKKKKGIIKKGKKKHLDMDVVENEVKKVKGVAEHFERWKSGTPMSELLRELGVKRRELKQKFAKLAGGKDALEALRAAGAGGAAFGGKSGGGRTKEVVLADDSKVKKIKSSKNWTSEYVYEPKIVRIKMPDKSMANFPWREMKAHIFVSPKGNRYVEAKPMEKADLLVVVQNGDKNPPIKRLKRFERSSVLKKIKQDKEILKHGLKAQKHRKKVKKEKRAARKAAKTSTVTKTKSIKRKGS